MKKYTFVCGAVVILLIASVWWSTSIPTKDPGILSNNGLHWPPELAIYVKGEKQIIPSNIGIGPQYASQPMGMAPVHTHDDASQGIIHLEFSGLVRTNDIMLGQFFENWGKNINSFGSNLKMTVNGIDNTQLENYIMQDKDKIELRYE